MKLSQLLEGVCKAVCVDVEIAKVTNDSRKVAEGDLYVAISGTAVDGHAYAKAAVAQGAVALIVEHDLGLPGQIVVPNSRQAYALICANYFGRPAEKMELIGVTGTNGKTSITTMVKHVLDDHGLRVGLIGTIQIEYGDVVLENNSTTPDAYLLHQTLAEMAKAGCQYVVMEVSSHALSQDRLYGCKFAVGAFTNLTQDHLDYHTDMEDYFEAKSKLFPMTAMQVLNLRDPYGKRLAARYPNALTFSVADEGAALYAHHIAYTPVSVVFSASINDVQTRVHFSIPGLYSVENALTTIGICKALGIATHDIVTSLETIKGISGRSEVVYRTNRMTVIRDYAHSPDSVENVLASAKEYVVGRLVALFGCGGDRDRGKRPKMAAAAAKHADLIIVTSDNPRSEDPDKIIAEVLLGLPEQMPHVVLADRYAAIDYAMRHAEPQDTILLLGKGHETYQVLKNGTIHFDEREVVAEIAKNLSQEGIL